MKCWNLGQLWGKNSKMWVWIWSIWFITNLVTTNLVPLHFPLVGCLHSYWAIFPPVNRVRQKKNTKKNKETRPAEIKTVVSRRCQMVFGNIEAFDFHFIATRRSTCRKKWDTNFFHQCFFWQNLGKIYHNIDFYAEALLRVHTKINVLYTNLVQTTKTIQPTHTEKMRKIYRGVCFRIQNGLFKVSFSLTPRIFAPQNSSGHDHFTLCEIHKVGNVIHHSHHLPLYNPNQCNYGRISVPCIWQKWWNKSEIKE